MAAPDPSLGLAEPIAQLGLPEPVAQTPDDMTGANSRDADSYSYTSRGYPRAMRNGARGMAQSQSLSHLTQRDRTYHAVPVHDGHQGAQENKERIYEATFQRFSQKLANLEIVLNQTDQRSSEAAGAQRALTEELQRLIRRSDNSDSRFLELRFQLETEMRQRMQDAESQLFESASKVKALANQTDESQKRICNRLQGLERIIQARTQQDDSVAEAIRELQDRVGIIENFCSKDLAILSDPSEISAQLPPSDAPNVSEANIEAENTVAEMKVWEIERNVEALKRQVVHLFDSAHGDRGWDERIHEHEVRLASVHTKLETIISRAGIVPRAKQLKDGETNLDEADGLSPEERIIARAAAEAEARVATEAGEEAEAEAMAQALAEQEEADRLHAETTARITSLVVQLKEVVPRVLNHEATLGAISKQLELLVQQGQNDRQQSDEYTDGPRQKNCEKIAMQQNDLEGRLLNIEDKFRDKHANLSALAEESKSLAEQHKEALANLSAQRDENQKDSAGPFEFYGDAFGGMTRADTRRNSDQPVDSYTQEVLPGSTGVPNADHGAEDAVLAGSAVKSVNPKGTAQPSLEDNAKVLIDRIACSTSGLHDMQAQLQNRLQVMNNMLHDDDRVHCERPSGRDESATTQALLQQFSFIVHRVSENEMKNIALQHKVENHMSEVKDIMQHMAHIIGPAIAVENQDAVSTEAGSPESDRARRIVDEELVAIDGRIIDNDAACKALEENIEGRRNRLGGLFDALRSQRF